MKFIETMMLTDEVSKNWEAEASPIENICSQNSCS